MDKNELIARIKTVIDMESRSASMAPITPLYVSRMLNVSLEDVEKCMKEMEVQVGNLWYDNDDDNDNCCYIIGFRSSILPSGTR